MSRNSTWKVLRRSRAEEGRVMGGSGLEEERDVSAEASEEREPLKQCYRKRFDCKGQQ